jgi:hypothetical protein
LVVIVTDRVVICRLPEERGVSGIHVEEPHRQAAFMSVVGGSARSHHHGCDASRLCNPDKQIFLVVISHLLPHLEEAMDPRKLRHPPADQIRSGGSP